MPLTFGSTINSITILIDTCTIVQIPFGICTINRQAILFAINFVFLYMIYYLHQYRSSVSLS